MRRPRLLAFAGTLTVLIGLISASTVPAIAAAAPTTGVRFVDITAADGVVLKANVNESTSPGRHPTIVFVNSWGLNDLEYLAQADKLATPATPSSPTPPAASGPPAAGSRPPARSTSAT
jgi:hypothetical protein